MRKEKFNLGGIEVTREIEVQEDQVILRTPQGDKVLKLLHHQGPHLWVRWGGKTYQAWRVDDGEGWHLVFLGISWRITQVQQKTVQKSVASKDGQIKPPMPGTVVKILVKEGEEVKKGQPLIILESMKMEHPVEAPMDGKVKKLGVKAGDLAELNTLLLEMEPLKPLK